MSKQSQEASNQNSSQDTSGGNVVGKAPSADLYQPAKFMGKSGQPDNQEVFRGKGKQ
jgi:hypothetical protein